MKSILRKTMTGIKWSAAISIPWVLLFAVARYLSRMVEANIVAAFIGAAASFYFLLLYDLWRNKQERYKRAFNAGVRLELIFIHILESAYVNRDYCRNKQQKANSGIPAPHPRFEMFETEDENLTDLFTPDEASIFHSTFVKARELNTNMASLDTFFAESIQAFYANRMGEIEVRNLITQASSGLGTIDHHLSDFTDKAHSTLAYLRARGKSAKPGLMRMLFWSFELFDPIPPHDEITSELQVVRTEYANQDRNDEVSANPSPE